MAKRGNPAQWDPMVVFDVGPDPVTPMGIAFVGSGGRKHHYVYRTGQNAKRMIGFQNRLYNGFGLEFEDGSMHLSYKRNDRSAVRDWRHVQAIKNEVAGPEREAVELFPPESELVDAANEYHLWVLPTTMRCPLGFAVDGPQLLPATNTHDQAEYRVTGRSGSRQRGWEDGIPTGLGCRT